MASKNQKMTQSGNKTSPVMILMLLVTLVSCGMAGYMFYKVEHISKVMVGDNASVKEVAQTLPAEPLYVSLGTFTVSLQPTSDWKDPVAYIGLTLRVSDEDSKKIVEKFLPEIRSRIFMLLALNTAEKLSDHEGKRKLIDSLKRELSSPLAPEQQVEIADVLINEFILR